MKGSKDTSSVGLQGPWSGFCISRLVNHYSLQIYSLEKQQIPFSLPSFNSVCLENFFPSEEKISFFRVWLCAHLLPEASLAG